MITGEDVDLIAMKQRWLVDHLNDYVIRSKEKDEVILFEENNIRYYCELEVSVNCLELILLALTADNAPESENGVGTTHCTKYLKKILASLVEDVARHAIVIEYSPLVPKSDEGEAAGPLPIRPASGAIDEEQPTSITENQELHFVLPYRDGNGTTYVPKIRLVQSSLRRNVKRRKAKPEYPVYMWLLGGSSNKRIIPPKHATDFYYRLLEGRAGYPLNYWGACVNDLASQGIVEVVGKRVTICREGAELVGRLFDQDNAHGGIYWKVWVSQRKNQ